MKEVKIDQLIEKYKNGKSSLEEEQYLFSKVGKENISIAAWSSFVKLNKKEAANHLNDKLWDTFQQKINKKRTIKRRIFSAAAAILLLIAISTGIMLQEKISYNKKKALLTQAQNMFVNSKQETTDENIIYEDEQIIIYTSKE